MKDVLEPRLNPRLSALATLTIGLALLGGCASTTQAPLEQIKFFSQAFVAVNTVGQPLLDDLALAERAVGQRQAELRAQGKIEPAGGRGCAAKDATWAVAAGDAKLGVIDGYCNDDAGYFANLGDPRATERFRGALRVIERYADVLQALAEGRNLDQALGQVDALGQEVGGLLALVGAEVAIAPVLTAMRPLLADIARQANADEARRLILDGAPTVSTLIGSLRSAAPEMFKLLIAAPRRAIDAPATVQAAVKEVEARRQLVSQYVVLLGRLQTTWDATVVAARNPGGSRLADVVARSAEIRADADAVRRSLAELRSGFVPKP